MTAKILEFPIPMHAEAQGWICGCGGEQWVLYANGEILCPRCNCISTVIKVVRQDPTIERLRAQRDAVQIELDHTVASNRIELDRLRRCLEGVTSCSTCPACRGAAEITLGLRGAQQQTEKP